MKDEKNNEDRIFEYLSLNPDRTGGEIERETRITHATVYRFLKRRLKSQHLIKDDSTRTYRLNPNKVCVLKRFQLGHFAFKRRYFLLKVVKLFLEGSNLVFQIIDSRL